MRLREGGRLKSHGGGPGQGCAFCSHGTSSLMSPWVVLLKSGTGSSLSVIQSPRQLVPMMSIQSTLEVKGPQCDPLAEALNLDGRGSPCREEAGFESILC